MTAARSAPDARPVPPADHGAAEFDMGRYDIFARFAERHLATDAQRRIYLVLVSQQARLWSAGDLATQTGLQPRQAERVLTRYLEADIVQDVGSADGGRYRWRSDLNYLLGADDAGSQWLDPVCDMPVTADSPYQVEDASGRTWRFCASVCLALFVASPDRFTGSAG